MKKIEAIIKPFKLDEVKDACKKLVFKGLPWLKKVLAAKKVTQNLSRRGIRRRFPSQS